MQYNEEKILIVDDEQGLLELLRLTLEQEHYKNITCATTATEALEYLQNNTYDIILLDVMLPDHSGFDLCQEIRKTNYTPIIFISAMNSDFDKLTGLTIGGDDYITKPFNPLEVVARVKATLRRQIYSTARIQEPQKSERHDYGRFALNPVDGTVVVGGVVVDCTAKEYELLKFFCENPNRIFTTSQIYEAVWGELGVGEEKTVGMHILKLRKKLGDDSKHPEFIVNQRGIGYKFVPPKR